MSTIRSIKTYADATLSGAPLIVKFDGVAYYYAKFYPTISAAASATADSFDETVAGYADATLSGAPVAIQIMSGGIARYLRGYSTISAETESYAGAVPVASIHPNAYLYGTARIGVLTINGTPYYAKMYPYQVTSGIYDMGVVSSSHDQDYISIIYSPTNGNFPTMTASGELQDSDFGPTDFDSAGTGHTEATAHIATHESTYTHANIATAYGWGNHASAGYAASSHLHTGVYDPAGTGHTEAAAHVATHESTYTHANIANGQTAYGWGNHASVGYSLISHLHKGIYSEVDHTHEALSHNHNDIYYTESEIATYLAGKSSTSHTHSTYASSSTLTAHTSSTSNPHSVTKAQVGLSTVENTALSTWAGTSSITNIGQIVDYVRVGAVDSPSFQMYSTETHANARNWATVLDKTYYGDWSLYMSATLGGAPLSGYQVVHAYMNGVVTFPLGGVHIGGDNSAVGEDNLYVDGNCSALSFTDRTPMFSGDAVSLIKSIKAGADGNLDHDSLPLFARATYKALTEKGANRKEMDRRKGTKSTTQPQDYEDKPGRDIGNMVSILTVAIQQLTERIETLEAKRGK
jgi:hypothetical protein